MNPVEAALEIYAGFVHSKFLDYFHGSFSFAEVARECETAVEYRTLLAAIKDFVKLDEIDFFVAQDRIATFLRRSGIYHSLAHYKPINSRLYSQLLINTVTVPSDEVRLLAPLYAVEFSQKEVRLPGFSIRRYSTQELGEILETGTNAAFFPDAVVDTTDISDYWFIDTLVKKSDFNDPYSVGEYDWGALYNTSIPARFTHSPPPLENPLMLLVLWDWEESKIEAEKRRQRKYKDLSPWSGFEIPFLFRVNLDYGDRPAKQPDIKLIGDEPGGFDEAKDDVWYRTSYRTWVDAKTMEIQLSEIASARRRITDCGDPWLAFNLSVGFLLKAFFSAGRDQLLWHITSLEALVGDPSAAVQSLARRTAHALASADEKEREIEKQIRDLYDIRSDLVHGRKGHLEKDVYEGHLKTGRVLARGCLVWFARFVELLGREASPQNAGVIPDLSALRTLLDLPPNARVSASWALNAMSRLT